MPSPPIIGPPWDDVAQRTEKLAAKLSNWKPPTASQPPDPGQALIHIFDRMARHVIDRVNRMPDRSFLAFLNVVGVEPTPPRPAVVPLTFKLVEQGNAEPIVPAGTRVGASFKPGDTREIVFETKAELATTRSRLEAVFIRDPNGDRYADRTAEATGKSPHVFSLFEGTAAVEHALYIGADDIFGLPAGTNVWIDFGFARPAPAHKWKILHAPTLPTLASDDNYQKNPPVPPLIAWEYWNGLQWTRIFPTVVSAPALVNLKLTIPPDIQPKAIHGSETYWFRARLQAWPEEDATHEPIPSIENVVVGANASKSNQKPETAAFGARRIDLSMDFYPMGERPAFNDAFYVACEEVLSKREAYITLSSTPSVQQTPTLNADDAPELLWEMFTTGGWVQVHRTIKPAPASSPDSLFQGSFQTPMNILPVEILGKRAHWLRLRLIRGNFGRGSQWINGVLQDFGYRPPLLQSLTFAYDYASVNPSPRLFIHGDSGYSNLQLPQQPFQRSADPPCLYLGFSSPFANRNTSLYIQVTAPSLTDFTKDMPSGGAPPKIVWEYFSQSNTWLPLGVEDGTAGLIRSGVLSFIGPVDFARQCCFDQNLYWIRAKLAAGFFSIAPRLGRVLTNTVWAAHTATMTHEILGSSDGRADQCFFLSQQPVLEGQAVDVLEPDGLWRRWQYVGDFYASGPQDRHYRLDRRTGELQFGNGHNGMIPPPGARNIRATHYCTGGGEDGNREAGTFRQLKTTVSYVDSVINHEPSSGGTDFEDLDRLQRRGPRRLRHGDRAVTIEDIEDLALGASAQVVRAHAIALNFSPITLADNPEPNPEAGQILVCIVASNNEIPPTPSLGLIQDVETYLNGRCPATASIRVIGPEWIRVDTTLSLVPASLQGAEALRARVEQAIFAFLHPLSGGFEGIGWRMGQIPEASDIYRLLRSIPEIEAVLWAKLSLYPEVAEHPAQALVYPGTAKVTLSSGIEGM